MKTELDMIVIGGGMVGASAALGLAQQGFNLALIEKNPLPTFIPDSAYDLRISAISQGSIQLLEKLGVWSQIATLRSCPYTTLETWEIEGFNTAFSAAELGLEKLGDMVENNLIQLALWEQLNTYPNCQQAVEFEQIFAKREDNRWLVTVDDKIFSAPVIIAADGANSKVRQWAGIGLTSWQYRQHCLLATITSEKHSPSTTWQQFLPSGPRAFLPLSNQNGCIVWYDSPQQIKYLNSLSPEKLTLEIQKHFPNRLTSELGQIKVQSSGSFPLTRQHARHYVQNGVVLVGDAAHTINPLAGQGVNLGFKDVKILLEIFEQAVKKGENFADEAVLKRYEKIRKPDNLLMQTGMDLFYKAFKTELLPLKIARNLGLVLAEKITPIKKLALKYAIGI
ncbi:2-octaprenyl-3-methyl-6-methoxy-1,4-benzoquinol hydroxylase [Mannheimia granulomatis]|uniref:2-octaprenyl-3-methyl-6-methoxy-1,4-benzoquinol hydroxylase n=1 Tax=Mannheimia granulomatis TaxID=85402 RepID=A0A011NCT6_9PAST|nr:FAD-dependent oxidoreductase [Mannheimia granulomatis]EXI62240.1 2-octaprenyl-3-methyl-6-methoxy-1,4-benzoquinol hydroxylase [Mannheimia granulomatis]RGE47419.1 2-octaprenyl-3-methyl-6-methoxy-1,4-benzoquinol hydroxylase [Mannheimia granulomatis]